MTRGRGHVADRLIAEDRDPTPAEQAHLDTCPECFAVARRRRPFDLRLGDASRDLVTEPLPREVLLVDSPNETSRRWLGPGAVIAAFLVVVAVGVGGYVAWASMPGGSVAGDRTDVEEPVDTTTSGVHVVEVPGDDVAFMRAEGGVMIVSRLSSPEPQILTKMPIPVGAVDGYAMVCRWSEDLHMGFVYGVFPTKGPLTFLGPAMAEGGSDEGLYLFAFNPFEAVGRQIHIESADGTGVAFGQDVFSTLLKEQSPNLAPGTGCADSQVNP